MVVIDASVAAKWFLLESDRQLARALQQSSEEIIAPELVIVEVMNVIWKNLRLGNVGADQIALITHSLPRQFSRLVEVTPLAVAAMEIAISLDHPIYDCFYIALAERERCELITADERLYRKTRRTKFASLVKPLSAKR